ncbi:hypothetical protein AUTU_12270 [Aureibacter tunicatorum]|nr:hypothetical protein AUTU_12270 [Aureibacter tunicatorum]
MDTGVKVALNIAGVSGGKLIKSMVPANFKLKKWVGGLMAVGALGLQTQIDSSEAKEVLTGLAIYGAIDQINQFIPESADGKPSALRKFVPALSGLSGDDQTYYGDEYADYEELPGDDEIDEALFLSEDHDGQGALMGTDDEAMI